MPQTNIAVVMIQEHWYDELRQIVCGRLEAKPLEEF